MAVNVNCPGCRTSYPVTEDLLGKKIRCKKCQETFTATASKSAVATRASDERITTRRPDKGGNGRRDDDEDDAPRRNGNGRAAARRPAAKSSSNKGLLIGGIAGGVLLLAAGVGLGVWMLNKDDGAAENTPVTTATPPISTGTEVKPIAESTAGPKVEADKPANVGSQMKTADAPDKLTIVRDQPRPADIRPDTVERIKKAAAWITVTMQDGGAWGSGWIAERHGNEAYVITNSHVVGMKEVAAPPPEKIVITLDAGLPTQREYDAKLLALDREEDLAVLRIKGQDLPPPLKIAPSYDLLESQRLLTMGFPLGGRLVKDLQRGLGTGELKTTLKVRPTSIAGRIFNKDGSVKYLQIEGGVDHGNSGGAAVDTNGNVVAVVVAEAPGTNMKFIIPSEYVIYLLLGRVLKVVPEQAVGSLGSVRQPIVTAIADPLNRLRRVDADVWTGVKPDLAKGEKPIRAGGDREPDQKEGDGQRVTATLEYDVNKVLKLGDAHIARAEFTLPAVRDDQVYWFRPHYYAKDGSERWGEAIVLEMGRYPVEPKPAHLAIEHKKDTNPANYRQLEIDSRQAFGYEIEDIGSAGNDLGLKATLMERVTDVNKNGDAKIDLQYKDLRVADSDTDAMIRKQLKGVMESVKGLREIVTVTKDGKFLTPVADFAAVPHGARPFLKVFNEQIIESLEAMALSLPGKEVQPGETWGHETAYTFSFAKHTQNALLHLTCKFVGTRTRAGREEAVIEILGRVQGTGDNRQSATNRAGAAPGAEGDDVIDEEGRRKIGIHGMTHGAALVDLATGHVTVGRTESELAVVFPLTIQHPEDPQHPTEVRIFAGLYLDVTLRRSLNKDAPKAVDVTSILPNQPRVYNPLVGVGTPVTVESASPLIPERNTLMPPDVMDRVKHAAVMISVERNDGGGEGSGWFAAPGIIVTNCHVVGMLNKADRPPEKITVYLDRGTEQEQKLEGELMAINRDDDLSVIRVKADHLPSPFKIAPAAGLIEANRLSILGFPLGSSLKHDLEIGLGNRDLQTTLKERPTIVTGRVPNADGSIKYVQFEGGADHGNSGGPIVDSKGEVRAILVAGFDGSELRWGIPSEYADRMIQGYPLDILPGRAYLDGSIPKQPIEVRFSDPLGRLTAVAIDYWVGYPGKPRKATDKKPKPPDTDGPRHTMTLTLKTGERPGERLAAGEFVLPEMPPGQICWLQPRFTNGTGKEQWGRGVVYAPDGPPVERKPATLAVQYRKGTRRGIELTTFSNLHYILFGREYPIGAPFKVALSENILGVNSKTGITTVHLEYKDLELDLKKLLPGLEEAPRELEQVLQQRLKPLLSLIRGLIIVVNVTRDGHMKNPQINVARVPFALRAQMLEFNDQIYTSLQALTFPMPGKEVPYGYTWDMPTDLFIAAKNKNEAATFKMQFKYVGVRSRAGREEAVVEITGSLAHNPNATRMKAADAKDEPKPDDKPAEKPVDDPPGPTVIREQYAPPGVEAGSRKKGLYGDAHGYAFVDVKDGFVSEVKLYIDLDVEMQVKDSQTKQDVPVVAGGTMELQLRRRTAQVSK